MKTDNEIAKTLNAWADAKCENCSFSDKRGKDITCKSCVIVDIKNAVDLLRNKDVEIEKLQEVIFKQEDLMQILWTQKQKYYDELVSLKMENESLNEQQRILICQLAEERDKTVKEFMERLKKEAFACDVSFGYGKEHFEEAVAVLCIENIAKEMEGDSHELD